MGGHVTSVSPEIEQLLRADDLDLALSGLAEISEIGPDDAALLAELVLSWDDPQAIANMVMHPVVIPIAHRVSALLRALASDARSYSVVAAIVGLRSFEMPDDYRRSVGNRLVDLAATDAEPVSSLASVTLGEYLLDIDTGDVLAHFGQFGETARHNALLGLVDAVGADDLRTHIAVVRNHGRIADSIAAELTERLDAIGSEGGLMILARIPSLTEWNERPSPRSYP